MKFLVWRNVFGDPDAATPFRERVTEIVRARRAPPRPGPDAEDPAATRGELTRSGLFTADDTFVFRWSIELDDRHVVEHYQSWLIVLTPRAASRR